MNATVKDLNSQQLQGLGRTKFVQKSYQMGVQ